MVRGPELQWIKKKVCDGLGAWPRAFDALGGDERQLFLDLLDNANNGGQVNPSVVVYTSSMEPDECREMYGPLTGDAPEADSDEAAATTSAEESAAAELLWNRGVVDPVDAGIGIAVAAAAAVATTSSLRGDS